MLALVTDAYGGTGGIAQYARDLIRSIASHPAVSEVVVVPRVIHREMEPLPAKVVHTSSAAGSKARYLAKVLQVAMGGAGFDLIICGHANLLPVARVVSFATRSPLVLVTYGIEVWEPKGFVHRRIVGNLAAVVSISDFTLSRLREWADIRETPTFLLPNAIDLSAYTPGPKDEALRKRLALGGSPVLLTLGRMEADERAKGFDEVLEVLPSLIAEYPGIVYCLAGDGTDRQRLKQKTTTLGLDGHTVFAGYVTESEKLLLYRIADVFVMPSRMEGFGYVFLEALAIGIPVIASRVDGSREAVRDGRWGELVDPQNPEELRNAIRRALSAPSLPPRSELEYFSTERFNERCHQ
ncbi:MAG: glycosyltransferase family 4 protein, partial [Nocardioidaceae bacterium]